MEPADIPFLSRLGLAALLLPPGLAMGMLLARLARRWAGDPAVTPRSPAFRRVPGIVWITAILWVVEGWRAAGFARTTATNATLVAVELFFLSALVLIAHVDWKTMLVPDSLSLGGIGAGMFFSFLEPRLHPVRIAADLSGHWGGLVEAALGAATGIALATALRFLGGLLLRAKLKEIREKDPGMDAVLGLGDVKLLGFLGAFLGARELFPVLFLAALAGSIGGIIMKLRSGDPGGAKGWRAVRTRWRSGDSVFPFGPFLAGAATVVLLLR